MKLNNGIEIPQIGVGTWTLKGETARENVRLALEAGFRHIDTAQGYENEVEVGLGILDSGISRDKIFLTTKVATNIMREGAAAVAKSIDESLLKLGSDYVDLLLIHWPVKDCVKHTWQVMEEYVKQGKVRSIGVSNFNQHHLNDLLEYAKIVPVINQIEVHPYMTQVENIAINHNLGIQVEAWGPFGQGDIDILGDSLLQSLAEKYSKTASQIVLRWIVQRDLITIPRAKPNHFAENLEVMTFELSHEDMDEISSLNKNLRSNAASKLFIKFVVAINIPSKVSISCNKISCIAFSVLPTEELSEPNSLRTDNIASASLNNNIGVFLFCFTKSL